MIDFRWFWTVTKIFFKDKNLISSLFLLLVFNIFHTFFTASIAEFE